MNRIALPTPTRRTDPITHPSWCEHAECKNNLDSATVDHKQVVARREVMGHDALVEVDLVAADEFYPWNKTWAFHSPEARLYLNWTACLADVPCVVDHQVPVQAEVYLGAAEARRLAADLLEVADRIEAAGGAR